MAFRPLTLPGELHNSAGGQWTIFCRHVPDVSSLTKLKLTGSPDNEGRAIVGAKLFCANGPMSSSSQTLASLAGSSEVLHSGSSLDAWDLPEGNLLGRFHLCGSPAQKV